MSGPKVVRVVTREELEAISRREIAVATAAANELLRAYRKANRLTNEVEKEVADQLGRLETLKDRGQFAEVQRQAPQAAAFLRSEAARISQEAIAAAESAIRRRRRVGESARSLVRALEVAGRPVPAELLGVEAKTDAAGAGEMKSLEAIVDSGLRLLVQGGGSGLDMIGAEAIGLASRLSKSEQGLTLDSWVAAHASESPASERLDNTLAVIETLGAPVLIESYRERARSIGAAAFEKQPLLIDSLLLEASRDARRVREEAGIRARLMEAAAALDTVGTAPATVHADLIRQRVAAATYADADDLLLKAASLSEHELSAAAAEARRNAVLSGLAALGYEVREGMATAWVREGRLVVRKPGSTDYGVEIGAPVDVSRLQVRLVGSDRPASPRNTDRDHDQEVAWCSEFGDLQKLVRDAGAALTIERAAEAGAQPVKTIRFVDDIDVGARDIETPIRGRTIG
jgi:hypothetical protein